MIKYRFKHEDIFSDWYLISIAEAFEILFELRKVYKDVSIEKGTFDFATKRRIK